MSFVFIVLYVLTKIFFRNATIYVTAVLKQNHHNKDFHLAYSHVAYVIEHQFQTLPESTYYHLLLTTFEEKKNILLPKKTHLQ